MAKKKQSESVATKMTMVLRPRKPTIGVKKVKENAKRKMPMTDRKFMASGKLNIGKAAKTGTAVKRKFAADEGNTKVVGSGVKKLKTVMNKNEMNKDAAIGSTRVLRSNRAKKGDESGRKESAEAKTKKVNQNILAKKEAPLTSRSPDPKKKKSVKKEASHTIGSPKLKKNLPAEASQRITRKGGTLDDPLSKEQAKDTIANKHISSQGFKNQETGTNKKNELIKKKKTNIVVPDSMFPPEIIMEILSWLPTKFFGAPMVVCKQWYALIQDRHFIEMHMRRNTNYIDSEVRQGYMKVYDCDGMKLEMNTSTQKYRIRNPDTKQFLEIPDPHKGSHCIVFLYVPCTSNYKIVSIFDDKNGIECCEVLSVGMDELSWRLLKMPTEDYLERNRKKISVILIDDVVHCVRVIASGADMIEEVVSLDLGTEQFTITNLPKGLYKNWERVWPIYYKRKLAIVDIEGAKLRVMVLENHKKQKWGKKESLVPLKLIRKLEVDQDGSIFPYFVDQSERMWFWVPGIKESIYFDMKKNYMSLKRWYRHSLVRLKGMQPELNV